MDIETKGEIYKEFIVNTHNRLVLISEIFVKNIQKHSNFFGNKRFNVVYSINKSIGHYYPGFECDYTICYSKAFKIGGMDLFHIKFTLFYCLNLDENLTHEEIIETAVFPIAEIIISVEKSSSKDYRIVRENIIELSNEVTKFKDSISQDFGISEEKIKIKGFGKDLID